MTEIKYLFDEEKNTRLKKERGVCFDDVLSALADGRLIQMFPHHNQDKYAHQDILAIEINDYAYLVPCIIKEDEIILKTIYPSRKATERFLRLEGGDDEKD